MFANSSAPATHIIGPTTGKDVQVLKEYMSPDDHKSQASVSHLKKNMGS
jgi:hypothetical protein